MGVKYYSSGYRNIIAEGVGTVKPSAFGTGPKQSAIPKSGNAKGVLLASDGVARFMPTIS